MLHATRPIFLALTLTLLGCDGGNGGGTSDAAALDAEAADATAADATPDAGGGPERSDVTLSTSDGLTLTGYLTTSPTAPPGAPGVLLVHQFQRDDEQWGDLAEELATAGYRVLAFNLRGHGDSDPYAGNLIDLLTDPIAAPLDVEAALDYLRTTGGADPTRIAIVGTSIGANLTVAFAILDRATTYVSLSSRQIRAEGFAGGAPATGMTSVFYLAGENDAGGQAADAQTMYDQTTDPRQIQIYAGSADHGIDILDNQPDARGLVVTWLAQTL